MKLQLGMKNFFEKTGVLTLLIILLFACTTSPEIPQSPTVKPTETKISPATGIPPTLSTPENDNPPVKNFSIQNANKVAPADVLEEVKYNVAGGGFGCGDSTTDQPAIYLTEQGDPEWMATIGIFACGWKLDELVQMTLSLPNGKSIVEELQAQGEGGSSNHIYVNYIYMPKLEDPAGVYSIRFSGNSGIVEQKINITKPNEPKLYYIHDIKSLFLYSFQPDERVRLFLYASKASNSLNTLSFIGWQEYQTDSLGQLLVSVVSEDLVSETYGVVGDKSGMVNRSGNYFVDPTIHISFFGQNQTQVNISNSKCPGVLPSKLEVGKYAYLSTNPPLNVRVRSNAGLDADSLGFIQSGDTVEILEGPQCLNEMTWWKVKSTADPNLVGWSSEGDTTYLLFPCSSGNSCP